MVKVKTFTTELKPFHTMHELENLDEQVNSFIAQNGVKQVLAVSDSSTSDGGATIGLIRVVTYEA